MIDKFYKFFRCPDDLAEVSFHKNYLKCQKCDRHFNIYSNNLVEILPQEFPKWNLNPDEPQEAEKIYYEICAEKFIWKKDPVGWGNLSVAPPGYRGFVKTERKLISKLIPSHLKNKLMIDVSGGCGNYSIYLAPCASLVFHCEADSESLQSAYRTAANLSQKNIIFVRANYLRLPFPNNLFDIAICTDTLIRGKEHEIRLLKEINRILNIGGIAIVDFHNPRIWPKNSIRFYTKNEIYKLLYESNINDFKIYPFGYCPIKFGLSEFMYYFLDKILKFIFPPCRYIVVFKKYGE